MSSDPDQIRAEIEATRTDLSANVDALTYKASPRRAVTAPVNRARGRLARAVDKVMGTAQHAREASSRHAAGAAHQTTDALSSAGQRARALPEVSREQTQGSPLAAGLIAFGVGLLASSLIPPSNTEQQVAERLKRQAQAHSGTVKQQAADLAHQAQDNLRGPAQQATEAVKSTATRGAAEVRDHSTQAARHIREEARDSGNRLRDNP
ncbi:DUF3618 domain-containing protein [Micromonospora sp. CPCC 206060]|uniref:DUF3618 domain-containing protein n=1 Tax=Micromonospora sp. CPCC 206060 TaxID=3122406 RepID=UPI002FF0126B